MKYRKQFMSLMLLLFSCSSHSNQTKDIAEKFVQYSLAMYGGRNNEKSTPFKVLEYNVQQPINGECIVIATMENLEPTLGDSIGVFYVKLKQFATKGWAVIEYDIRYDNTQPNWSTVPQPLNEDDLTKIMAR